MSEAACAFSREANRGLSEHPQRPQLIPPIIATAGKSHSAAVSILGAGVPIPFAAAVIYELAKSHNADDPVKSLNFFVAAVVRRWEEHKAVEDVRSTTAPTLSVQRASRLGKVNPGAQMVANILGGHRD